MRGSISSHRLLADPMASSLANQMPTVTYFFFLLLFVSSTQIHARESMFFSKTTREQPKEEAAAPTQAQEETKEEGTPAAGVPHQETRGGYGLYGHGPQHYSPSTRSSHGTYNYNGGASFAAAYNYGKQWKPDDHIPSTSESEYETTTREYWNNRETPDKEYYDANDEGSQFEYKSERGSSKHEGYGVYNYGGERSGSHGGGRYGYGQNNEVEQYYPSNQAGEEEFSP